MTAFLLPATRLRRLWPMAAVAVLVVFSLHPMCDLMFRCGCEPVWASGVASCNIHVPQVPHCPWCTGGKGRLLWVLAIIGLCAGAGMYLAARAGGGTGTRFLAGAVGYVVGAVLAAVLAAWLTGYPLHPGL